jgi:DNA-binding transcriptional LysR family regulator
VDRLLTMTAFTKVVQCGSFTVAAADLGISRALVSRYIADLEGHLGVRLLNRTTRYVKATEQGQSYFDFCNKILGEIRDKEESLSRVTKTIEGRISIVCPKWVGFEDMSDALTAFCAQNPRINCDLVLGDASSKTHSFLEHGHDIAIFTREVPDSRVKIRRLADISYVVAASPQYLKDHGIPEAPRDLRHYACLVQTYDTVWRFNKNEESLPLRANARFTSNTYTILCKAAVQHLGIALLPSRLAMPRVQSGELQLVLEKFNVEDRPLYAGFAPVGTLPHKVRTLLTFLSEWFRCHSLKM